MSRIAFFVGRSPPRDYYTYDMQFWPSQSPLRDGIVRFYLRYVPRTAHDAPLWQIPSYVVVEEVGMERRRTAGDTGICAAVMILADRAHHKVTSHTTETFNA